MILMDQNHLTFDGRRQPVGESILIWNETSIFKEKPNQIQSKKKRKRKKKEKSFVENTARNIGAC